MKKILWALVAVVLIVVVIVISQPLFSKNDMQEYVQDLNYTESLDYVSNPDQGFYRTSYVSFTPDGASKALSYMENVNLYHLRMDISEFSGVVNGEGDKLLTEPALTELKSVLEYYKQREKSVIVRFSYDKNFNGNSNFEPETSIILEHVEQICSVLDEYEITITAIEAGMVGPWGEMHTSTSANSQVISAIIDKFLTNTTNIPILVRTPKMIYDYLGITIEDLDDYVIDKTSNAYRLGIFNDGYLGSSTDLGTYSDREQETTWLSNQTGHLPFGGEVTSPTSTLHDIDNCTEEMRKLNLSYLNYEWNYNIVQNKWQNTFYSETSGDEENYYGQTAYTYIQNRLGYRLVLRNSVFYYNDDFKQINIKLTLENVGFGNFNRTKTMKIIFISETGDVSKFKVGEFSGQENIEINLPLSLSKQNYDVYIMFSTEENGEDIYSVALANSEIYNDEIKANYIGKIVTQ